MVAQLYPRAPFDAGAKAEKLIVGCEGCSPENAELPFVNMPDRVTGNDAAVTDYIFVKAIN